MLKWLGEIIEKRPGTVILIVLMITIGFSMFIPSIEIRTDFKDFLPDDETVQANWRVINLFGQSQAILFLYLKADNADSVISIESLKEQYFIEKELLTQEEVASVISIITILDQICFLQYGRNFENCTNEEIEIAITDILTDDIVKEIKIFDTDDPNEAIDYKRYPRISKGKSIDEIDLKNCYISYDDNTLKVTFEVYDLSKFESKLKSPIPLVNVVEWYLDFENIIRPDPRLDIDYRLAVHLEPKHAFWEIGKGPLDNIKDILNHIRNRELLNAYDTEVYLWIKTPEQPMYFPIALKEAEINLDVNKNLIEVTCQRQELGNYGISLRYGSFELPVKLTNFKAGTRYYQTQLGKLPWLRISANTTFLFERIEKIRNRPILGKIATNLLQKYGNMSWEDFDMFLENSQQVISLPDQIALKDIDSLWKNSDVVPDQGTSSNILFLRTQLFEDIKISTLSFISKDYAETQKPKAGLIIVYLKGFSSYQKALDSSSFIVEKIQEIDKKNNEISIEVTGDLVISTQLNKVTTESNIIIMPLIFVIIVIVLLISFRSISYVLLPLISLVVSIIWLFGTMVLLDIPFTTMSVALVPLLMGLGVDYSVHLSYCYRSELSKGKTPGEAIKISVLEIGNAMFLAMITTVIAFLSFLSATIPPLRDFGLLLGLGIFYTFITAITLQASVRYSIDRKKQKLLIKKKQKLSLNKAMGKLAQLVLTHQKTILALLIFITIIAGFGATQIKTGFDLYSFLPEENKAMNVFMKIENNFPYVGEDQEYYLIEGNVATVKTLKGIMETHENLKDDTFVTRNADNSPKAESIYTIIIQAVNNNQSLIEEFNLDPDTKIPKTDKDVQRFFNYLLETEEYSIQTGLTLHKTKEGRFNAIVIRVYTKVSSSEKGSGDFEKNLALLNEEMLENIADYGEATVIYTGAWIITYKITSSLTESQILSTGLSLLLAGIVLIIAYKRFSLGIIAILPVMISIVWILGTMHFIGYSLDVLTITVTSLTIGIGVDYAIHATERFRLVADKTGDIQAALCETIANTGGALLIAAFTTVLGFGMLILAPMPPQAQFGVIMVLTITYSFITSVLLLPLILARWAKWSKKKKGFIISSKPADEEFSNNLAYCKEDKK